MVEIDAITCKHCGLEFDPHDLTQVVYHSRVPHVPVEIAPCAGALRIDTLPGWVRDVRCDPTPAGLGRIVGSAARMADLLDRAVDVIRLADTKCYGVDCAQCKSGRSPEECDVYAMEQALREWRGDAAADGLPARAGGQRVYVAPDLWVVYRVSDGSVAAIVETKSVFKAIATVVEERGLDRSELSACPLFRSQEDSAADARWLR